MIRKSLSIVLAIIMVLALVPAGALSKTAENEFYTVPFPKMNKGSGLCGVRRSAGAGVPARDDVVLTDLIMNEDFEGATVSHWDYYNADGQTAVSNGVNVSNWVYNNEGGTNSHSGSCAMLSFSYYVDTPFAQDNWLISPPVSIPDEGYFLSCYARSFDDYYMDHMEILVADANAAYPGKVVDISAFAALMPLSAIPVDYTQYLFDLSEYAGRTVCLAFRHVDEDNMALGLDDVTIGLRGEVVEETGVTLDNSVLSVGVTEGAKLNATVVPENASFKDVTWTSSNTSVVAVNNAGGLIGMSAGTATVTATSHSGLTATCSVTVTASSNSFMDNGLIGFGLYNIDNDDEDVWYSTNRFGASGSLYHYGEGSYDVVVSEYDPWDAVVYAYIEVGEGNYNFVSIDPYSRTFDVTVIREGVESIPVWMTYDPDTNTIWGGFGYTDGSDAEHFDISAIDKATGLAGDLLVDVYNEPCAFGGQTAPMHFEPLSCTYTENGAFIGADKTTDRLVAFVPGSDGFSASFVGEETISAQIGELPESYQKMWRNPLDGMIYWTGIFANKGVMTITDIESGITAVTGPFALSGGEYGTVVTALFVRYTIGHPHTVRFVDGLTGEVFMQYTVPDGGSVTMPQPPVHEGYSFIGWDDPQIFNITTDKTYTALYEGNLYNLTINYVYGNGGEASPAYTAQVRCGDHYEVASPAITGFTADIPVVSGDMGAGDLTVTVTYAANAPSTLPGDVDCNGSVTMADLTALSAYLLGKGLVSEQGLINADVDHNGVANVIDMPIIYQYTLLG